MTLTKAKSGPGVEIVGTAETAPEFLVCVDDEVIKLSWMPW